MNCTTEATVIHGRIMIVRYRLHGFGTCRKTYKFYDIMKRLFWTQTKIISLNHDILPVGTGRRGDAAKSPTGGKPALATAASALVKSRVDRHTSWQTTLLCRKWPRQLFVVPQYRQRWVTSYFRRLFNWNFFKLFFFSAAYFRCWDEKSIC